MSEIVLHGVLAHTENPKHTAFVFEIEPAGAFGVVQWTGVYWQVRALGSEPFDFKDKDRVRRKCARADVLALPLLENNPLAFFESRGKVFTQASDKQRSFIRTLGLTTLPERLNKHHASGLISGLKFYQTVFVKRQAGFAAFGPGGLSEERAALYRGPMSAFLARDHSNVSEYDLMTEFYGLLDELDTICMPPAAGVEDATAARTALGLA